MKDTKPKMTYSSQLKRYFTTGLLAMLPIALTVWVILALMRWVLKIAIQPFFNAEWINFYFSKLPEALQPWVQGIIGLIVIFVALCGLGILATNVAGKWFFGKIDNLMKKVPLANTVYGFVQAIADNLRIMKAGYFQSVVLVEYPRKGIWALGFVCRQLKGNLQDSLEGDKLAVFIPTSPNPTSGFIVLVDTGGVVPLDMSPEEGLKFIVSGGVIMPGANKDTKVQE